MALRIDIRSMSAADAETMQKMMPAGVPAYWPERFVDQAKKLLVVLIAWEGDVPIGHLVLRWKPEMAETVRPPNRPHLSNIGVRPDRQSQGVGSRLMGEAEALAVSRGYRSLGLSVGVDNPRAKRLYERLGYVDTSAGVFTSRWPILGPDGQERWQEETCIDMAKSVPTVGQNDGKK
jgi:ribosomal protein S18 acetylase RimI-like enzyme